MTSRLQSTRVEGKRAILSSMMRSLRCALPVWFALAMLTSLPYVVAWIRTPPGSQFTGVLTAYDDTFSYFAWIEQAAQGRVFMCDLYTSEPQRCEFFLPLWVGLGFVAGATGLQVPVVFHAARLVSALLMLTVAAWIIGLVFRSRSRIRWTLWLYAFGAGLGWMTYFVRSSGDLSQGFSAGGPVDLNLPEAIAFRSAFAQVHFQLGSALLFAGIGALYLSLQRGDRRLAAVAGLAVSALAVIHPYVVVVLAAVAVVLFAAWPWFPGGRRSWLSVYWRNCGAALFLLALSLPGIVYLFYLQQSNELLREWLRITDTRSPTPDEYLLGFGLVAIAAVPGVLIMARVRGRGAAWKLIVVWLVVQAAMLYSPVSFQRRLVEGLQLPLTIAASVALFQVARRLNLRRKSRALALASIVVLMSITNIGFVVGQLTPRLDPKNALDSRRYLQPGVVEAFRWIKSNTSPDSVVLCSYLVGNVLPAFTARRVYVGHYGLTIDSPGKSMALMKFFSEMTSPDEKVRFLRETGIKYVLAGPEERARMASLARSEVSLVYSSGDVDIYAVESDAKQD